MTKKLFDHTATLEVVEQKVGVESFEILVEDRRTAQYAMREDEALYGPYGLWDERRRALRGAIADELREAHRVAGTKMTETAIEDAACRDARYVRALEEAFHGKMRYLEAASKVREMEDRLKNRDILLRLFIAESGMTR